MIIESFPQIIYYELLATIVITLLGVLVLITDKTNSINRIFFLLTIAIAGYIGGNFLIEYTAVNKLDMLLAQKITIFFAALHPPLLVFFSIFFPYKINTLKIKPILIIILPSIFFSLISFTNIYINELTLINGIRYGNFFIMYKVFALYFAIYLIYSFYTLIKKYRTTSNPHYKKQLILVITGLIISYSIGSTFSLILPIFNYHKLELIGPIGVITLTLFTTYAITKHELMDIRLAITKTFSYIISLSLLCISYVFPLLIINNKLFLLASVLLLSVFWAFYFLPFSNLLITTTKRKFIKGYYEPAKVLLTISDMLSSKTNRESIFSSVLDILDDALELEQSTFIIAVRNKEDKLLGYQILANDNQELTELAKDNPLINYFKNDQSIFRFEHLDDDLRAILLEMNYSKNSLVFPLHSPELLEGILLLGKRSSGKAYKTEDINFLKQLRAILTSAFYKLTPYEKIENNFLDTQKKLYDAERNLARTERIASLANLIQEYNHEIKTPLAVLVGLLDNSDLPEDKKKKAYAQTSRIGDIVRTTLRLSSAKEGEKSLLNINEVIEQALYILPLSGISVKKQLSDTPNISGHTDDLQIMITNLMQNAKEAMPNGGTLTIKTTSDEEHVIITIADTGCGIPEELREKVFEPFFSTHVTKGRGLGLPIVFRIVREHLGMLDLKSEVNKGTTFTVKLPINS